MLVDTISQNRRHHIVLGGGGGDPHTQHSAGCGHQGDYIFLPSSVISDTLHGGEVLANQWARYRYGVFQDIIHTGDHQGGGQGGNNIPDTRLACPLASGDDINSDDTADDSIGNNATTCNQVIDHLSPTRHQVLCGYRPVLDIILSHADLSGKYKKERQAREVSTQVLLVREAPVKYLLMIDTSVDHDKVWSWVEKAVKKFLLFSVSDNTPVAVLAFTGNNSTTVQHPLQLLTSESVRYQVADTVPGVYHLTRDTMACAGQALQVGVEDVLQGECGGAHVILVTRADTQCGAQEETLILNSVKTHSMKVSVMSVSDSKGNNYGQAVHLSGGRYHHTHPTQHPVDIMASIDQALSSLLVSDGIDQPITLHSAGYYHSQGGDSHGSWSPDQTLARDTVLGIITQDTEDHLIKNIQIADIEGNNFGPYNKMSSTMDIVNIKSINYVGQEPPFAHVR